MGINGQQGSRKEGDEPVEFIALSFAFDKLAQLLDKDVISSFAITRTTMGEVFTDFAKFQINAAAEADDDEEEVEA
jgi:replication initiation and membrane attachment protein DnaB